MDYKTSLVEVASPCDHCAVTLLALCHLRCAGSLSGHHCHTGAPERRVSQVSPVPALHQHHVPWDFLLEEASLLFMCSCINSLGCDPWACVRNLLIGSGDYKLHWRGNRRPLSKTFMEAIDGSETLTKVEFCFGHACGVEVKKADREA